MAGERAFTSFSVDSDFTDADQNLDAMLSGFKWDTSVSKVITYSFIDSASDISYDLGGASFLGAFSSVQEDAARTALDHFATFIDVTFDEIGDDFGENNADGTLRFAEYTGLGTAYGYYPDGGETGGDMAFSDGAYDNPTLGSYDYTAGFLHELGHTMGLKHSHEDGGEFGEVVSGPVMPEFDSHEYSVMTYHSYVGQPESIDFLTNEDGHNPQTLMMFDIVALQFMYGANFTTHDTDSTYTFSTSTGEMSINGAGQGTPDANVVFRTVWDGGGTDTYDLSNYTTDLILDLRPGGYTDLDVGGSGQRALLNAGWGDDGSFIGTSAEVEARGHLFNAFQHEGDARSLIENAIGGRGNDLLVGNQAANSMSGGAGKDKLLGNGGKDALTGGAARDKLFGGGGDDILKGGNGRDVLKGGNGRDEFTGGAGNDKLVGGGGKDTFVFNGKAQSGADKIVDFKNGVDMIEIAGISARKVSIDGSGGDTVISWAKGSVTLLGVESGLIDGDDINFV